VGQSVRAEPAFGVSDLGTLAPSYGGTFSRDWAGIPSIEVEPIKLRY
jgi:hypothetical protein